MPRYAKQQNAVPCSECSCAHPVFLLLPNASHSSIAKAPKHAHDCVVRRGAARAQMLAESSPPRPGYPGSPSFQQPTQPRAASAAHAASSASTFSAALRGLGAGPNPKLVLELISQARAMRPAVGRVRRLWLVSLMTMFISLSPHLSEGFDPLFHGCLPQPVDVEQTRQAVAMRARRSMLVFALHGQGRGKGFVIAGGRAFIGVALIRTKIQSTI